MSRMLSRGRSLLLPVAAAALFAALALRAMPASADTLEVHVQSYVITRTHPSMSAEIAGTLMPGQAYIVTGTQVADGTTWYALITPDGTSLGWADAASLEVTTPDTSVGPDVTGPELGITEPSQTAIQNNIQTGLVP